MHNKKQKGTSFDSGSQKDQTDSGHDEEIVVSPSKTVSMKPRSRVKVPHSSATDSVHDKSGRVGRKRPLDASSNGDYEGTQKIRLLPSSRMTFPLVEACNEKERLPWHPISEPKTHRVASSPAVPSHVQTQTVSSRFENNHATRIQTAKDDAHRMYANGRTTIACDVKGNEKVPTLRQTSSDSRMIRSSAVSPAALNLGVSSEMIPVFSGNHSALYRYQNYGLYGVSNRGRHFQESSLIHHNFSAPRDMRLPDPVERANWNMFCAGPSVVNDFERARKRSVIYSHKAGPLRSSNVACADASAADMMHYCLNALSSSNGGVATLAPTISNCNGVPIPLFRGNSSSPFHKFTEAQVERSSNNRSIVAEMSRRAVGFASSGATEMASVPSPFHNGAYAASRASTIPAFDTAVVSSPENVNAIFPVAFNTIGGGSSHLRLYGCSRKADRLHGIESLVAKFNQFGAVTVYPYQQWKERMDHEQKERIARQKMLRRGKKYILVAGVRIETVLVLYRDNQISSRFPNRCTFMHTGVPVAHKKNKSLPEATANGKRASREKNYMTAKKVLDEERVVVLNNRLETIGTDFKINERSRVHVVGRYDMEEGYKLDVKRFLENESLTDGPGSRRFVLNRENLIIMLMVECGIISSELSRVIHELFGIRTDSTVILRDEEGKHCLVWGGLRSGVYEVSFT